MLGAAALGVPLSEAGHLLAYFARFGEQGVALQTQGVHSYLPGLLQLCGGGVGLLLLGALLVLGLGRLLGGKGGTVERSVSQPARDLLLVMAVVQLDIYIVQEMLETLAAHQVVTFGLIFSIIGWGLAGQLPVAIVAALGLSWLSIRLHVAVERLRSLWIMCLRGRLPSTSLVIGLVPSWTSDVTVWACGAGRTLVKRGPPPRPLSA